MVKLVDTSDSKSDWGNSVRVRFPLSVNIIILNSSDYLCMKENTVILIDDDGITLNKTKALLESSSIKVLTAENLYELMSKIYKYNIDTLIFNPNLVWINVIEFINELKKVNNESDFKIFFISENIDKNLKEEAKKLNIKFINNNSNISKLVQDLNK